MPDEFHERNLQKELLRSALPRQEATDPVSPGSKNLDSPDWAAQVVLAAMIAAPDRQLLPLIQERFPGRDLEFHAEVLATAKWLIEQLNDSPLHKSTGADSSPVLIDRLSFAWRFLYKGDVLVWKLKQAEIPRHTGRHLAEAAFRNILPDPLQEPLLTTLLEWLRLGQDARHFVHYWTFRRSKAPCKLRAPFGDIPKTGDHDLLRTVIWWSIRSRREVYVEVRPDEPVRIEFAYVVEQVLEDLKGWCGPEIEQIPNLAGEVESELNWWLRYSRLEPAPDDTAPDTGVDPEIAKAFVKQCELTTKLRIHRADTVRKPDERVQQLEATIRQYAEENRALEERIRVLESAAPAPSLPRLDSDSQLGTFSELREVLKTIDTKYSFDTLSAVGAGEVTHLTLRSFVSHLFYALRKRGLSEYPKEDQFALTYEASGLYDCEGFEVPPSGNVPVKVTRKGWALNVRGRWLPIRRARVSLAQNPEKQ